MRHYASAIAVVPLTFAVIGAGFIFSGVMTPQMLRVFLVVITCGILTSAALLIMDMARTIRDLKGRK